MYKKCLFNKMETHFGNILSKYQCIFRKRFNCQHCLIVFVEKWEKNRGKGGSFAAILTDLSKVFAPRKTTCLWFWYGFSKINTLIYTYMCGRKQRVKINDEYNSWEDTIHVWCYSNLRCGAVTFQYFCMRPFSIHKLYRYRQSCWW